MDQLVIGQIGVGYWGPNLLRNAVAIDRCRVKMVADPAKERQVYVEKNFPGIAISSNAEEILNDPEINAVIISTPAGTHYKLALDALNHGKHILVEKPMASTPEEVEQIGATAKQKHLVAMVGHTFVYNSAVRYLRELINNGELGQVRYIYCQRLNLGRIRSDVDALWNLAPHDVSIIQYLFGDPLPLTVQRHGMDYVQRGVEDVTFLNITYPNKVLVNIHVSWLDPNRTRKITIVGSDKMAIFDDAAQDKITICDKGIDRMAVLGENMDYDHPAAFGFSHRSGGIHKPQIDWQEPLKVELDHFVSCVLDGAVCLTGPEHALRVVRILSACKPAHEKKLLG